MEVGFEPGPEMGKALKKIELALEENPGLTKEEAIALL